MPKYIGNTADIVDWDAIVKICSENNNGDKNTPSGVITRSQEYTECELLGDYHVLMKNWVDAGYNMNEIEWFDYYPGQHFDIEVQEKIANFVNADPRRVFVSEVFPGKIVPWHWDIEDHEEEWLAEGELRRYVVFMQKPQVGHVLPLEKHAFYNMPQGDVWEWDNHRDWHAGLNLGLTTHYLFHFLGKPR
jgi:hypothetical protein